MRNTKLAKELVFVFFLGVPSVLIGLNVLGLLMKILNGDRFCDNGLFRLFTETCSSMVAEGRLVSWPLASGLFLFGLVASFFLVGFLQIAEERNRGQ